ncbi:hypothetical protein P4601_18205 [Peribacillus frigoritolerans]|uniref:hypothetical protein n=1 Tax=Peribacillus frigoritolerans TaxID=450367 RepID=UPI0011458BCE|nr:hypothetical protein [Peribacillus frigoritolerans]MED3891829.1 hypothetical protein [Peribacillus frigoritolerans]
MNLNMEMVKRYLCSSNQSHPVYVRQETEKEPLILTRSWFFTLGVVTLMSPAWGCAEAWLLKRFVSLGKAPLHKLKPNPGGVS